MSDDITLMAPLTAQFYSWGSVALSILFGTLWSLVGGEVLALLVCMSLPVTLLVFACWMLLHVAPLEYGRLRSERLTRETRRLRNAREDRELKDAAQERAKLASVAFGGSPESYLVPSPFFAEKVQQLEETVTRLEARPATQMVWKPVPGTDYLEPHPVPAGKNTWLDVPIPQSMLPQPNPPYYIHDLVPPGPVIWKYNAGEGRRKYEPCTCRHAHLLPAGATCLYCGGLSQREMK